MTRKITLLATTATVLFALPLSGSASAGEPAGQSDQCDQEGQGLIVVGRTVANRPVSLSGKPIKVPWRRCQRVYANEVPDPDDEPIEIVIPRWNAEGFELDANGCIKLKYGAVRAGVAEGAFRSDMDVTPPIPCLGKKG